MTEPPSAFAIGLARGWIGPAWVAFRTAQLDRERARDRERAARKRLGLPSLTACHSRGRERARASEASEPVRLGWYLTMEAH